MERQIAKENEEKLVRERQAKADARFKADEPARKKVSEALKDTIERQRKEQLQKSLQPKIQQSPQEIRAESQRLCAQLKQQAIAAGENLATTPGSNLCAALGFPLQPAPTASAPKPQPASTRFNSTECQLFELAQGADWQRAKSNCDLRYLGTVAKEPPNAATKVEGSAPISKQQYDSLRQNAGGLQQPEQRRVASSEPPAPPGLSRTAASTFTASSPTPRPASAPTAAASPPFVPRIGRDSALNTLPYALMSRDAYSTAAGASPAVGFRRVADWETVLRQGGIPNSQIQAIRLTGFYAAVYRNDRTGEVTIAYRGSENALAHPNDWVANYNARVSTELRRFFPGYVDPQYQTAADLARMVKNQWSTAPTVTLTGHSLGGALATYAGTRENIGSVVTFNAARNHYSTQGGNSRQINVSVTSDLVGDAATGGTVVGTGTLPGQHFSVQSSTGTGVFETHGIDGIIGGLSDAARAR